ncbi:MAG: flagellar basal body rod protein FlgC [bacterium]|nr:flagellar basal body rod protein FlgC [bacterium]
MSLLKTMEISASGLTAQRLRLDIIANNLANAETTRTERGVPYRRQVPIFREVLDQVTGESRGVEVLGIREDNSPFRMVYDPGHPDANPEGYVLYPNVNPVIEMTDMISATRSYEANLTLITSAKNMFLKALEI